jgi:hypothetical protein
MNTFLFGPGHFSYLLGKNMTLSKDMADIFCAEVRSLLSKGVVILISVGEKGFFSGVFMIL